MSLLLAVLGSGAATSANASERDSGSVGAGGAWLRRVVTGHSGTSGEAWCSGGSLRVPRRRRRRRDDFAAVEVRGVGAGDSYLWAQLIGEMQLPFGEMGTILVAKKKKVIRGSAGEEKVSYLPQYNRFTGMRDKTRGLLEMLGYV